MKTRVAGMTAREAEKLWQWRNSWAVGTFDCYKALGVQVFAAMLEDGAFRKMIVRRLQIPKKLRTRRVS